MWKRYDGCLSNSERVDQALAWLSLPTSERPHLLTLCFSNVDSAGHKSDPESPIVAHAVTQVDNALGDLFDGIERLPYGDQIALVLVSDHDMGKVDLDTMTDLITVTILGGIKIVLSDRMQAYSSHQTLHEPMPSATL